MLDFLIPVVTIVIGVLILLVFTRALVSAYVKAPANRAFVRTGGLFRKPDAPPKVVMNGGVVGVRLHPRDHVGGPGHDGD